MKTKKVTYVVGASLDGVVSVDHVISEEKEEPKPLYQTTMQSVKDAAVVRHRGHEKRNCGHSQKSVRMQQETSKKTGCP